MTTSRDIFQEEDAQYEPTAPTAPTAQDDEGDIEPVAGRRRIAADSFYRLFWSNAIPIDGKENEDGSQASYSGWYANDSEELDPILAARNAPRLPLFHAGTKKVVEHYIFKSLKVIPLITGGLPLDAKDGFPGDRSLARNPDTEWFGTAAGWRKGMKFTGGREKVPTGKNETFLQFPVLIPSLLEAGYTMPVILSVRATVTENMAVLIEQHVAACVRAKQLLNLRSLPCYGAYLTLGIGAPERKGGADSTKIPVPAAVLNQKGGTRLPTLPDVEDDKEVEEWYNANIVPDEQRAIARSHVRQIVTWSREYSIASILGEE